MSKASNLIKNEDVHQKVLSAITDALKEEKVSATKRFGKIAAAASLVGFVIGGIFLCFFRSQLNWIWTCAGIGWFIYLLIGFTLLFKPQARLQIPGVWSPFVIARLFLISTLATIAEIIICPSFVFLDSPLAWNPLLPLSEALMSRGGMQLCMGFCGFLFAAVAGGVALYSVRKISRSDSFKSNSITFSVMLISQLPILFVQFCTRDLRAFAPYWVTGILLGFFITLIAQYLIQSLQRSFLSQN